MDTASRKGRGPRGRGPSPAKTAETRRTLVAAALDVFLEHGFAGTRMDEVAERAGLAKGTLYLYFDSKEALFEGVLREVVGEPLADLVRLTPDGSETVRTFILRVMRPILRDLETTCRAGVMRLVMAEGARFPAVAETYRRVVLAPMSAAIRDLARRAVERGEMQGEALLRFPMLLVSPAVMATVWNGLYGREEPMDASAIFEAFLDILFKPIPANWTHDGQPRS